MERERAKTIQHFQHNAVLQKKRIVLAKFFHAWRICSKREIAKRKLLEKERETQRKMDMLLSQMRTVHARPIPVDDNAIAASCVDVAEVIPVTPKTPRSRTGKCPKKAWEESPPLKQDKEIVRLAKNKTKFDPYENRHRQQVARIEEQTRRLQIQKEAIDALTAAKVLGDFRFYT